jgi:hypothetical protein
MKSTKFFALALGAIALFPAASFAQNVNATSQEATLKSTTLGTGNVTVQDTVQRSIDLQRSKGYGANVRGTSQKIEADTTTIGHDNIDVKKAVQEALSGQKAK